MVWFLVDDVLPFHDRVLRAGNAAMGLWVRAGAYCSGHLTDGFISADAARTMGSAAEIRKLVAVGLWVPAVVDDVPGYRFHAWAESGDGMKRQPTKAEVEEKRRKEREKKRAQRSGQPRGDDGRYVPDGVPGGQTRGHPGGSTAGVPPYQPNPSLPPLLASLEGGAPPVDNLGTIDEPPLRCPAHLGQARPPRCGACKDARLEHEAWAATHPPAAEAAPPPRRPPWDPETHCEHGQLRGACEACDYEASRSNVVRGPWDRAG